MNDIAAAQRCLAAERTLCPQYDVADSIRPLEVLDEVRKAEAEHEAAIAKQRSLV